MMVAPMMLTRRDVMVWLPSAMALVRCAHHDAAAPFAAITAAQASALDAYADQVLPPDGHALGAARYVDRLLSSAEPFVSSLGAPVPLDRVSKAAWDLRVAALKLQLEPVLASGKPVTGLSADDRELICSLVTEAAFTRPDYGGNPGGAGWKLIGSSGAVMPSGFVKWDGTRNVEASDAPVSTAEPGTDPHPFDPSTRDLLDQVTVALGGRVAP
jgi:hypothetical protein